jgi:MSHA biogenesis protein MshN
LTPQQHADNEYRNAILLLQQGKNTESIDSLERVLHLAPLHAGAREALIGLLLDAKRNDDAAHIAREGLDLDVHQVGLAMILARLQLEKGALHPAIETLQRSLPYAADKADYQAFLAALLQRDARHKEAITHYLRALGIAPRNGVWWMGVGISLQADHRLPEAREAFKRARETDTLSAELLAFVNDRLGQLQP